MARTRKYFKKRLVDLEVKGQCPTRVISVHDTLPYGHAPTCQISLTKKLWSGQDSLRRSRRSGRKNHTKTICLPSFEGETYILVGGGETFVSNADIEMIK
jgi:hypothetical protein